MSRRGFLVRRRRGGARRGLSLLEVMISIAILGGAMAAVGQLVRIGARSAAEARDQSKAQMLCENKLAQITSGLAAGDLVVRAPESELKDGRRVRVRTEASDTNGSE